LRFDVDHAADLEYLTALLNGHNLTPSMHAAEIVRRTFLDSR
jgi:hypothetical protein